MECFVPMQRSVFFGQGCINCPIGNCWNVGVSGCRVHHVGSIIVHWWVIAPYLVLIMQLVMAVPCGNVLVASAGWWALGLCAAAFSNFIATTTSSSSQRLLIPVAAVPPWDPGAYIRCSFPAAAAAFVVLVGNSHHTFPSPTCNISPLSL